MCKFKSVALCVRTQSCLPQTDGRTDGRTDRHSSNVLEFCPDQMSPRNQGSQIYISMRYKRIDKTIKKTVKFFYEKFGISKVLDCIDGTHVNIIAPKDAKHYI